jgi:hypothetical protein
MPSVNDGLRSMNVSVSRRGALMAAAVCAAVLALGACSGGGSDVATLGGKDGDKKASKSDTVEAMTACLVREGVPAITEEFDTSGTLAVGFDFDMVIGMSYGTGGSSGGVMGTDSPEAEAAQRHLDEMVAKYVDDAGADEGVADDAGESGPSGPPPYLILDDKDYTDAWRKCLDETGYTEPVYQENPAEEIKSKQATIDATKEWLKCARQNGYPDIKDPLPAKADSWETRPVAALPRDITEADLRALLGKCPVFDKDAARAQAEAMAKLPAEPTAEDYEKLAREHPNVTPEIGIDVPGWDGTMEQEDVTEEESQRLEALMAVLYEDINNFYAQLEDELGPILK